MLLKLRESKRSVILLNTSLLFRIVILVINLSKQCIEEDFILAGHNAAMKRDKMLDKHGSDGTRPLHATIQLDQVFISSDFLVQSFSV